MSVKDKHTDGSGLQFSYVMGREDPLDTSHKGFSKISDVNQEEKRGPPSKDEKKTEDVADGEKWKKNDMIPRRFDELPTEETWVNVSDVIRRQREEEARREAQANKLKPPSDSESDEEELMRPPSLEKEIGKQKREVPYDRNNERERDRKYEREEDDSQGIDGITESMLNFALRPGVMTKRDGLGRRSSLPVISSTPSHGKPIMYHEQRRGSLLPAREEDSDAKHYSPPRKFYDEHQEEHFHHSRRERHDQYGHEDKRERFSKDRQKHEGERQHYREPSPDYGTEEEPPRSQFHQGYKEHRENIYPQEQYERSQLPHRYEPASEYPQRAPEPRYEHQYAQHKPMYKHPESGSDPRHEYRPRQHDPGYDYREQEYQGEARQHSNYNNHDKSGGYPRYHDDKQYYQDNPRQTSPYGHHDQRGGYHDSRYPEDDYYQQQGRNPHLDNIEQYYEERRRHDYIRQESDPRYERESEYYRSSQYR